MQYIFNLTNTANENCTMHKLIEIYFLNNKESIFSLIELLPRVENEIFKYE